jgi:hypothetical protein
LIKSSLVVVASSMLACSVGKDGAPGPQGPAGSQGPAGPAGTQGVQGPVGADGSLRIYGNGSAGAKTVAASGVLADTNLQYTDFTVSAGATLNIPSGAVIRCTGTFTVNGAIVVAAAAQGSLQSGFAGGFDGAYAPASLGNALRAAAPGEFGPNTVTQSGGLAGLGINNVFQARQILRPGVFGGGGAGGSFAADGSDGGGSLVVLARTAVAVGAAGSIRADGSVGGSRVGGGGGGIIILASPATITIAAGAAISAVGGPGGASDSFAAAGGGGGGGIVHLLAPTTTNAGTITVGGGAGGTAGAPGSVGGTNRQGGGGGGGCFGSGGSGGSVISNPGNPGAGGAGGAGALLLTNVDPTSLF